MNARDEFPLIRLILPIFTAFTADKFFAFRDWVHFTAIAFSLLCLLASIYLRGRIQYPNISSSGLWAIYLSCFSLFSLQIKGERKVPFSLSKHSNPTVVVIKKLGGSNYIRYKAVPANSNSINQCGLVLICGPNVSPFQRGEVLQLNQEPSEIGGENDSGFDFATYYLRLGISHQLFVRSDQIKPLAKVNLEESKLKAYIQKLQKNSVSHLSEFYRGRKSESYALAMLLGERSMIEKKTRKQYSQIGVAHVLAVSGMHLGLLFVLIDFVLKPLKKYSSTRPFYILLLLICIWAYAVLTGSSLSVLRAALMLSLYSIGSSIGRPLNSKNILILTFIIMVFYRPSVINELGFQLSFLAVLGIITFGLPLTRIIKFRLRFFKWVWTAACISFSAHIFTFPIVGHHFHQHANLFLISNLLLVPLFIIFMYLGLINLLVSQLFLDVSFYILELQDWVIELLEIASNFVLKIPCSTLHNYSPNLLEIGLWYVLILLVFLAVKTAQKRLMKLALMLGLIWVLLQ